MENWPGPDFVIAGTQKAGTTWLERQLGCHPDIYTPEEQLHYFDRNYARGARWYEQRFQDAAEHQLCGEKTTEYFDTPTAETFAKRISTDYPTAKVIVILRDPVSRALSALRHMVSSGLEKRPTSPDKILFDDRQRPLHESYRYIERGFYAMQLQHLTKYIPPSQLLVMIFEEDIIENPERGLKKAFEFLGVQPSRLRNLAKPVNQLRLSPLGAYLSRKCHDIPYARGVIRRLDNWLHLPAWEPQFRDSTIAQLHSIFEQPNEQLYELLGRRIPNWADSMRVNHS